MLTTYLRGDSVAADDDMTALVQECRARLNSAAIADSLDTFGLHRQVLLPGLSAVDPSLVLCGLVRVGIYMPLYHDDENTKVYEHEIALIDSLQPDEVPVLCCHGITRIAPWGELLSERSSYLGAAGMLTDGCVRDTTRIRALNFPVYAAGTNPMDTKYRGKLMLYDVPGEIAGGARRERRSGVRRPGRHRGRAAQGAAAGDRQGAGQGRGRECGA